MAKLNELVREQELLGRGVITVHEVEIGNNQLIATADHLTTYLQSMGSAGRSDVRDGVHEYPFDLVSLVNQIYS